MFSLRPISARSRSTRGGSVMKGRRNVWFLVVASMLEERPQETTAALLKFL
jgi:hypothetical protein